MPADRDAVRTTGLGYEWWFHEGLTIISSKVSRLTLKGMFFMTIAVGIISSSALPGVPGLTEEACIWLMGGEPDEDRSELFGGERERLSGIPAGPSSHC